MVQPAAKVTCCSVSPKVVLEKVTVTPLLMDQSLVNDRCWLGEESVLSQEDEAASLSPWSSTLPVSREFNALGCTVSQASRSFHPVCTHIPLLRLF